MSTFDLYRDRSQEYSVTGKVNEYIATTRKGRGSSNSVVNNDRAGLIDGNTLFVNGDLCTNVSDGDKYFITAMQSSTDVVSCILKKTNATIDIVRVTKHYTGANQDYLYETSLYLAIPAFYEDTNTKMAMYDSGLLSTSTRRFLVPLSPLVKLLDRIKFNGEPMQIDGINTSTYQGMLWIQCSKDTRVTKVV